LKTRAFTKARTGKFTERTDDLSNQPRSIEWWLRFPASYYALVDPGDQSVSALLASVQAGHDDFIGLLVEEWEHASFLTLHGGAPFRPDIARQIVDGLAAVKDVETAQRILWRTAPERFGRTDHGFHEGASLEELTTRNLHAPLFWRVPAAAKVEFWRHEMERSSTAGIEMLARDLLGFRFDQDQDLREDVERLMESAGPSSEGEGREAADTRELHYMWDLFQERGLTFEFSPEAPPELIRRTMIGAISPDYGPRAPNWDRAEVLAQEALTSDGALSDSLRDSDGRWSIITTNLLGNYDPATATVTLYSRLLEWTAQVLHIPITDLENVVFLHETVHAICHLGRDLDGRHWEAFALPSSRDPVFKPSELHEGIAQYFTLRMIERLGDTGMMNAFEALSNHQPPAYQAWRGMRSAPIEQIRKLLMLARATFDEVIWPTPRG
jgi:hypothetical protein